MVSHRCYEFVLVSSVLFWSVSRCQDVVYNIREEEPNNTFIGNVANDSNLYAQIGDTIKSLRYNFLTQGAGATYISKFRIGKTTGDLFTNDTLDREKLCKFDTTCTLLLEIAAHPPLGSFFQTIKVAINLEDINDNAPTFPKSTHNLAVPESVLIGTSFTIMEATDNDTSDKFSLKSYEILPKDAPFDVEYVKVLDGRSVVRLVVKQRLNREVKDSYQIYVIAKDGGSPPKNGTLLVNVTVTDSNDNTPMFSSSTYNVTVNEDISVNSAILQLSASDADIGKNGDVVYRLSPHQSEEVLRIFAIDEKMGHLRVVQNLIYNAGLQYRVIVEASDLGDGPLKSQALVSVTVLDSGNNPPKINVNLLSNLDVAQISEYANVGAVVAHVVVVDADTGRNGQVSCVIRLGSKHFELQALDSKEYKAVVTNMLDRETAGVHLVSIFCADNGTPALNTTAKFNVSVLDENDHPPVFQLEKYTTSIYENNEIGAILTTVSATDADIGQNARLTYVLDEDFMDQFHIDRSTGRVKVNTVLDRESNSVMTIPVYAIDGGKPPLTGSTTVVISVLDVNESPKFNPPSFTFYVLENQPIGTDAAYLTAFDGDEGSKGQLTFTLSPEYSSKVPFEIFFDGTVKTNRELDREAQSRYDFTVVVRDGGVPPLSTIAPVTVFVTDDNDHSPVIIFPNAQNHTTSLTYLSQTGTIVTSILAYDMDEGPNAELVYLVDLYNHTDVFSFDRTRGVLSLRKHLSYSDVGVFNILVGVSDKGQPTPRTSWAGLTVVVTSDGVTTTPPMNITIPQTTKESAHNETLGKQNFLIAVTIATVTVVLSIAIIITIIIIRRIDSEKRRNASGSHGDNSINGNLSNSVTVFSLAGDDSSLGDRKKKKEVSFSLDEEIVDENSGIKLSLKNGNLSVDRMFESPMVKDPSKPAQEDSHSETSGETSTSDSGRGGSDDDIHNTVGQVSSSKGGKTQPRPPTFQPHFAQQKYRKPPNLQTFLPKPPTDPPFSERNPRYSSQSTDSASSSTSNRNLRYPSNADNVTAKSSSNRNPRNSDLTHRTSYSTADPQSPTLSKTDNSFGVHTLGSATSQESLQAQMSHDLIV